MHFVVYLFQGHSSRVFEPKIYVLNQFEICTSYDHKNVIVDT